MNVLLDTCALLALARGELSQQARAALRSAPEALVSTVTAWEIAIKAEAAKLELLEAPFQWFVGVIEQYRIQEVRLSAQTACAAASLPPLHRDPFDRVLVALALERRTAILTSDVNINRYPGVKTLW